MEDRKTLVEPVEREVRLATTLDGIALSRRRARVDRLLPAHTGVEGGSERIERSPRELRSCEVRTERNCRFLLGDRNVA